MPRILRPGRGRAACTCPRCASQRLTTREWRRLSFSIAALAIAVTAIAIDFLP